MSFRFPVLGMYKRQVRIIRIFEIKIRHGLSLLFDDHPLLGKEKALEFLWELRRLCRFARNAIVTGKQNENHSCQSAMVVPGD